MEITEKNLSRIIKSLTKGQKTGLEDSLKINKKNVEQQEQLLRRQEYNTLSAYRSLLYYREQNQEILKKLGLAEDLTLPEYVQKEFKKLLKHSKVKKALFNTRTQVLTIETKPIYLHNRDRTVKTVLGEFEIEIHFTPDGYDEYVDNKIYFINKTNTKIYDESEDVVYHHPHAHRYQGEEKVDACWGEFSPKIARHVALYEFSAIMDGVVKYLEMYTSHHVAAALWLEHQPVQYRNPKTHRWQKTNPRITKQKDLVKF